MAWYATISSLILTAVTITSVGYNDEKVVRLTKEAIAMGFNHFKMKVGANLADDLRRGKLIRSIIDDPQYMCAQAQNASNGKSSKTVQSSKINYDFYQRTRRKRNKKTKRQKHWPGRIQDLLERF
jgi:hypothetical protein